MRKVLLLLITLFVIGGGNLFAKTLNADLSKLGNGPSSTWDGLSNTITWTQQSNNMISNFNFPAGDYRAYEKIVVNVSDLNNAIGVRVQIKANGQEKTVPLNGNGTFEKKLTDFGFTSKDLEQVEWIRLLGSGYYDGESHTINSDNPASAKINSVYLEGPDGIEAAVVYEAPAGTTDLNDIAGSYAALKITYPKTIKGEAALLCGDGDGSNESSHADISDYDYLCFEISSVSGGSSDLRVWIWDGSKVVTLRPHPIADCATVTDWTTAYQISAPGTYAVKISEYNHLKGMKTNWGSSATMTISMAYLSKGSAPAAYLPSGKYTLVGEGGTNTQTLTDALADASATFYDATGVTGTGITLDPTNPNAIFNANDGVLANTKNVMVGSTIAKLDLTDGYPFAAPASATATAASYTRSMTNQFGTICLPYAVSSNDDVKYYTLGALSNDVLTLTAVDELEAGTPAIVEKVSGSSITAAGSGALTAVQAPAESDLQLFGSYEAKTILASDYEGKNIYAISDNKFVQATTSINLPAFRAYFVATPDASANIRFNFDDEEDATAINALTGEGNVSIVSIYSADGAQQSSLQKGINVMKLSNGEVKKIIVK